MKNKDRRLKLSASPSETSPKRCDRKSYSGSAATISVNYVNQKQLQTKNELKAAKRPTNMNRRWHSFQWKCNPFFWEPQRIQSKMLATDGHR